MDGENSRKTDTALVYEVLFLNTIFVNIKGNNIIINLLLFKHFIFCHKQEA